MTFDNGQVKGHTRRNARGGESREKVCLKMVIEMGEQICSCCQERRYLLDKQIVMAAEVAAGVLECFVNILYLDLGCVI